MYIYYKIICCPSSQWSPAGALFAGCVFKLEDLESPASAIAIGLGYTIASLTVIAGAGTVLRSEKVAGFHIGVAKCLKNATIRTGFLPYSIHIWKSNFCKFTIQYMQRKNSTIYFRCRPWKSCDLVWVFFLTSFLQVKLCEVGWLFQPTFSFF